VPESWTVRYFSQSNPEGPDQGDVPALLRLMARSIEEFDGIEVQDLVFETENTEDGPWPVLTVYFHLPEDTQRE